MTKSRRSSRTPGGGGLRIEVPFKPIHRVVAAPADAVDVAPALAWVDEPTETNATGSPSTFHLELRRFEVIPLTQASRTKSGTICPIRWSSSGGGAAKVAVLNHATSGKRTTPLG